LQDVRPNWLPHPCEGQPDDDEDSRDVYPRSESVDSSEMDIIIMEDANMDVL